MSRFLRHNLKGDKKAIGFTVAASYDENTARLYFGVAKCCKHDVFNKKTGRIIAENRLQQRPTFSVFIKPEQDLREVFNETFDELKGLLKRVNIKHLKTLKNPGTLKLNKIVEPTFEYY